MSADAEPENYGNDPQRIRRKADQAWEMAGCARQDGDTADELRWTHEAQRLDALYHSL